MSAALLLIHDETSTGERTNTVTLTLASERVTARELLRRRIQQEVADYNASQPEYFRGLVQPTDAERVLNGYRVHKDRLVDWREQFESAIQAFARNGFLMLAGDRQIEDLDAEIAGAAVVVVVRLFDRAAASGVAARKAGRAAVGAHALGARRGRDVGERGAVVAARSAVVLVSQAPLTARLSSAGRRRLRARIGLRAGAAVDGRATRFAPAPSIHARFE
jgi:hypothetical protein